MVHRKKNKYKELMLKGIFAVLLAILPAAQSFAVVEAIELKELPAQDAYIETIRVEMFCVPEDSTSTWTNMSAWGGSFYSQSKKKSVEVLPDHPEMEYRLWLQEQPAPLAVILPGTGAHCSSAAAVALADLLYKDGFSAVIISGALNYEFMESAGAHIAPGFPSEDAKDVYNSIKLMIKDIGNRYGKDKISGTALVGMSMGGLHALFISTMDKGEGAVNFDSILAIDPPTDMIYALNQIDASMNIWRNWPDSKVNNEAMLGGQFYLGMLGGKINPAHPLPISTDEARFLIGASFRFGLSDTIYSLHKRRDFGILKTKYSWFSRTPLYKEIDAIDFYKYAETFLIKYYQETDKDITLEKMNERSSPYSIANELRANTKVRVIHTLNDFLLRPEDPERLAAIFGNRITFFDRGGHLGNLYIPRVQERIIKYIRGIGPYGKFEDADPKAMKLLYPSPFGYSTLGSYSY